MSNPKPNPATQFKPGKSGNPNGKPPLPEDIKKARKLNKVEVERLLNEYLHLNLAELKVRFEHPDSPVIEVLLAKILHEGVKKGDEKRLGFILDRLGFTVKTKVSLDGGADGQPIGIALSKAVAEAVEQIEDNLPDDAKQFE